MPTYITLYRYTQQGVSSMKDGPKRLEAGRKAFEAVGGKLKDFYLVMGSYDFVAIIEAPDDAAVAKASLRIASFGAVSSETLRAFSEDEYRSIVSGLA